MALFFSISYVTNHSCSVMEELSTQEPSYRTRQVHTLSCRRAATRTSVSPARASGASWLSVLDLLLQLLTC